MLQLGVMRGAISSPSGVQGEAPGRFSYLAVFWSWNTLICNGKKLPIKVFDNLYPHVSMGKNQILIILHAEDMQ